MRGRHYLDDLACEHCLGDSLNGHGKRLDRSLMDTLAVEVEDETVGLWTEDGREEQVGLRRREAREEQQAPLRLPLSFLCSFLKTS
jgi:hypothetical protein